MSLRIVTIPLDKETWDNIAPIVLKSFSVYATNITSVKKWADKHEDKVRNMEEHGTLLETRLLAMQESLDETKRRLGDLHGQLLETCSSNRQQIGDVARCLNRLLRSSGSLQHQLAGAFGGLTDDVSAGVPGTQCSSPTSPTSGRRLLSRSTTRAGSMSPQMPRSSSAASPGGHTDPVAARSARLDEPPLGVDRPGGVVPRGTAEAAPDDSMPTPLSPVSPGRPSAPPSPAPRPDIDVPSAVDGTLEPCEHGTADVSLASEVPELVDDSFAHLLPELLAATGDVEQRHEELCDVVLKWNNRRQSEKQQQESLQKSVVELESSSQRTFDRLLTWRSLLKESSVAVDSLGQSLAGTQGVVQELKATQVRQEDVDRAVNAKGRELHELHTQTESRVNGLGQRVDEHVDDVDCLIAQTRKHFEDRVDECGAQLARILERNLSPVNAYLNRMHVKADAARAELDILNAKVPQLAVQIEEVATELKTCDAAAQLRSTSASDLIEELTSSVESLKVGATEHGEDLVNGISGLRQYFGDEVAELRTSLSSVDGHLDKLRSADVAVLYKNLATLEQKVAKWVHALPLPAKVSEARLFSLEARLADETDARLNIEHVVGMKHDRLSLTPRHADLGMLPQLPVDSGRKLSTYDAYRQYSAR